MMRGTGPPGPVIGEAARATCARARPGPAAPEARHRLAARAPAPRVRRGTAPRPAL